MTEAPATILHLIGPDTTPERLDLLAAILAGDDGGARHKVVAVGNQPASDHPAVDFVMAAPDRGVRGRSSTPPPEISEFRASCCHVWSPMAAAAAVVIRSVHPDATIVFDASAAASGLDLPGLQPVPVIELPNWIRVSPASKESRASVRRRLGLEQCHETILLSPPVTRASGASNAAWATMIVQKIRAGVRVLLPGAGEESARIQRLAEAAGQSFMFRTVADHSVSDDLLAAADLTLCNNGDSAREELTRAMRFGVPIVARACSTTCSLLMDEQDAWLYEADRPRDIARRLVVALEATAASARYAVAAREKAERLFDRSALVSLYFAQIQRVV